MPIYRLSIIFFDTIAHPYSGEHYASTNKFPTSAPLPHNYLQPSCPPLLRGDRLHAGQIATVTCPLPFYNFSNNAQCN